MIRTCFLLLCLIECFGNVSAQKSLSEENPEESLIVQWALQQHLVLNEQPGKTLRLGMSDYNGDYVVYTYEKLNDSVYVEKVEESNMEISGGQLYVKRGNQLVPSFLWNGKYIDDDWSGYSDSSGYLVKENLRISNGDSTRIRRTYKLDINNRLTESWISDSGTDTLEYSHYSNSGNCYDRTVYSISGTDSVKTIFSHTCLGNGAELLTDKKVFLWSWGYHSPIDLLVDEWIMPSGVKHSFDVVDLASEPTMINGKLVNNDLTKIRTDKNGFIKRITIGDITVGFNWQETKK